MQPASVEKITTHLLSLGVVTQNDLTQVNDYVKQTKKDFLSSLIEKNILDENDIGRAMADLYGVVYVKVEEINIPFTTLNILPAEIAKREKVIIFRQEEHELWLAFSDGYPDPLVELLADKTGKKISLEYTTPREMEVALLKYDQNLIDRLQQVLNNQAAMEALPFGAANSQAEQATSLMLEYAYNERASDIHMEPSETSAKVRYRIDGVLQEICELPKSLYEQIVTHIKVLAELRIDEHQKAQDGKFQFKIDDDRLDLRVSVMKIVDGEKVVLRLLSNTIQKLGLQDLGFSEEDLAKVTQVQTKPFGLVLSTGPTGSGKTTTLYSMLSLINAPGKNIATLEDPIEYRLPGINQVQINREAHGSFAEGLRALLRQDPDIIYVGEIRDSETATIAINSATTGHLVLSTLHTNNAATALVRLIDMGIEPFLVSSTVSVIIGQRLVRKICESCKTSAKIQVTDLEHLFGKDVAKQIAKAEGKTVTTYTGKGCNVCHYSGYHGRIGIFEVLTISPDIQKLILARASAQEIEDAAVKSGMINMLNDGLKKVEIGLTTYQELATATVNA